MHGKLLLTLHLLNFRVLTELPGSSGWAVGVGVRLTFHPFHLAWESKVVSAQLLQGKLFLSSQTILAKLWGKGSPFIF